MLSSYVVEDEPLARDELIYILNRTGKVKVLGESDNIEEALADIAYFKPDIVFLDIQLDEENGLSLAKQLEKIKPVPAICFVTAYDDYALEAFETNIVDYILKPYDEKRIERTLDKIISIRNQYPDRIRKTAYREEPIDKMPVNVDERIVLISPAEIVYFSAEDGKCKIKTINGEYKTAKTLSGLEKKLKKSHFLRVHRSYIVNVNLIDEIEPWFNSTYNLIMSDGSKIPVSRTYVKDLKRILGIT